MATKKLAFQAERIEIADVSQNFDSQEKPFDDRSKEFLCGNSLFTRDLEAVYKEN